MKTVPSSVTRSEIYAATHPGAGSPAGEVRQHPRPSTTTLEHLEQLADLMDSAWRIPGTNFRIGIDPFLGLVPGIGDLLAFGPHVYLIWHAAQAGAPRLLIARMGLNAVLDAAVGAIPVVGDLFDAAFKANRRNLRLFRRWLERSEAAT